MISGNDVVHGLEPFIPRLQDCLQRFSGENYGPEEGSDARLLFNALVGRDDENEQSLDTRFEQSGR